MKVFRYDMIIVIQYLSGHNFFLHHEKENDITSSQK